MTQSDDAAWRECNRLPKQLRRKAATLPPERKAYMVWSNRLESYRRVLLTDAEWQAYDRRGSID
jgi:hypothetical protein